MDDMLVRLLIKEINLQCRFALFAYKGLEDALQIQIRGVDQIFFFVHAFLSHTANVSKLLWPLRKTSRSRGEQLRRELCLDSDSPIRLRKFRNYLDHYDERLEDWASSSQRRNIIDRNVGPGGFILVAAAEKGDFHRNLDTRSMEFTFRGESCSLPSLAKEAEMLRDAAGNWLKNHDRLHRPC